LHVTCKHQAARTWWPAWWLQLADQVAADLVHLVDDLVDLVELPGPGPWSLARPPPTW